MTFENVPFVDEDEPVTGAARVSETLDSLTNLVYLDESDAGLVRLYAQQLQERLHVLSAVMNSSDPNMRAIRARLCN
jgi:hypothetical protein